MYLNCIVSWGDKYSNLTNKMAEVLGAQAWAINDQ